VSADLGRFPNHARHIEGDAGDLVLVGADGFLRPVTIPSSRPAAHGAGDGLGQFRIGLLQRHRADIVKRGGCPAGLPSSATVTAEIEFASSPRAAP